MSMQSRPPVGYPQTPTSMPSQNELIGTMPGNMASVSGWNAPRPGPPHPSNGHGMSMPGSTPYPEMSSLANPWNTAPRQSPSEAYYFQNLFKELNMPDGFESIYAVANSDAVMEGLGPLSRHHRRPHPGMGQPPVVGSMGPLEGNGGYYSTHSQHTPPPPQHQSYASHQASVQNGSWV